MFWKPSRLLTLYWGASGPSINGFLLLGSVSEVGRRRRFVYSVSHTRSAANRLLRNFNNALPLAWSHCVVY
jgi:hypothetical protein